MKWSKPELSSYAIYNTNYELARRLFSRKFMLEIVVIDKIIDWSAKSDFENTYALLQKVAAQEEFSLVQENIELDFINKTGGPLYKLFRRSIAHYLPAINARIIGPKMDASQLCELFSFVEPQSDAKKLMAVLTLHIFHENQVDAYYLSYFIKPLGSIGGYECAGGAFVFSK